MKPSTHALLIAGGSYHDTRIPELKAPLNDLRMMVSLLLWRYTIPAQNILVVGAKAGSLEPGLSYRESVATRQAILAGLAALAERVRNGDHVVVYYSGHGTVIPNVSSIGPLEWNALVAADYDPFTTKNLVLEQDLWAAADRIPTHHQTWILDCCFSGGFGDHAALTPQVDNWPVEHVSKALDPQLRLPKPSQPFLKPPSLRPDPPTAKPAPFTLLAACHEQERAEEARFLPSNGRSACAVSEFTWALYHTLWQNQTPLTLAQLTERTRTRLKLRGLSQTPLVATSKHGPTTTCLAPFPWTAPQPRLPVLTTAKRLRVGCLAGVASGQRLQPAQVEVTQADWFAAHLKQATLSPWLTLDRKS